MAMFRNMKVRTKILGLVGMLIGLMALSVALTVTQLDKIGGEIEGIAKTDVPLMEILGQMTTHQLEQAVQLGEALRFAPFVSTRDTAKTGFERARTGFTTLGDTVEAELKKAEQLVEHGLRTAHTAQEREELAYVAKQIQVIAKEHTDYEQHGTQILQFVAAGNLAEAEALTDKVMQEQQELDHTLEALLQRIGKFTEEAALEAEHLEQATVKFVTVVAVLAMVAGLGLGLCVARGIARPLAQAVRVAEQIAAGDLENAIAVTSTDETGRLLLAMQTMSDKLRQIVGEIRQAATTVSTAASEIVQGNTDLSQRTQEQASALEETASSMEEMTSTVKQNADNARQANQLAASARTQAEQGGAVVGQAVAAMAEISHSSRKIAEITSVIDGIAFQTNLLALNAAVEAARAGEQGRGFAVVAAEVRKLAQRSADAAKEIKTLIVDSGEKVDGGTRLVDESGKVLAEIVTAVKKVSDIVAEIAAASQEQAAGIEQVNKAVMQMDEVTQQNAALVEEAAAASESVEVQARQMRQLMEFFTVEQQGTAADSVALQPHQAPPVGRLSDVSTTPTRTPQPHGLADARAHSRQAAVPSPSTNGRQPVGAGVGHDTDSDWSEF
jgi:methyl-accepting chemotaxis protein